MKKHVILLIAGILTCTAAAARDADTTHRQGVAARAAGKALAPLSITGNVLSPTAGEEDVTVASPGKVSRFSGGVRGGWGRRLGKVYKEAGAAMDGVLSGYVIGAEAYYHFHRLAGIGLDYSFFNAIAPATLLATRTEKTWLHHVAPAFIYTMETRGGRGEFFMTAAPLGFTAYREQLVIDGMPVEARASTVSNSVSIGYYARAGNSKTSIGIRASLYEASLGEITYTNARGQEETVDLGKNRENISTFQLTLGLRFR